MDKVVGIGRMVIATSPEDRILTFALASCVAVTAYHPVKPVAGMIHIALASPPLEYAESIKEPYYYASLGLPLFFRDLREVSGFSLESYRWEVFGGAASIREDDSFEIGLSNRRKVQEILQAMRLPYSDAHTGGTYSRTLTMSVATGETSIVCQKMTI